jgi:hypothetical protein
MNAQEAADIVRSISKSIRENPAEFRVNISIVGQQVTSHGGTGQSISAVGGGSGSTTIGQRVGLSGTSVRISQDFATEAMNQELKALVDSLDAIAIELESASPNKSKLEKIYNSLKGEWVPGVITSVIGNVLSKVIGL